jgi:hypothetical protein
MQVKSFLFISSILSSAYVTALPTLNHPNSGPNDKKATSEHKVAKDPDAPYFFLGVGPPGAGKTSTRNEAVKMLIPHTNTRPLTVLGIDAIVMEHPGYKQEAHELAAVIRATNINALSKEERVAKMEEIGANTGRVYWKYRELTKANDVVDAQLNEALTRGDHIFYETPLGKDSTANRIRNFVLPKVIQKGYQVVVIQTQVDNDNLMVRNWNRAAGELEGGRLPTPTFILQIANYMTEKQPVKAFMQSGLIDRTLVFDNNGNEPKLVYDSGITN